MSYNDVGTLDALRELGTRKLALSLMVNDEKLPEEMKEELMQEYSSVSNRFQALSDYAHDVATGKR